MKAFFNPAVKFVNKLRYSQKLMLLGTIVVFIICILSTELLIQAYEKVAFSKKELVGVSLNKQVVSMLQAIEEYRRIENMMTLSDIDRKTSLLTQKENIQNLIKKTEDAFNQSKTNGYDQKFLEQAKLKLKVVSQNVSNIESLQEGFVIKDVSGIMTDICDFSNLMLDFQPDTFYLADTYCTKLTNLSEQESLLRGVVNKFLTSSSVDSENKLYVLRVFLEKFNLPGLQDNVDKIALINPSLGETLKPIQKKLALQINSIKDLFDNNENLSNIDPILENFITQFFGLVKTTNEYKSIVMENLTMLLSDRINNLYKYFYVDLSFVFLIFLIFLYLFLGVYFSIIESIRVLIKGAQKISKGHFGEKISLNSNDELNDIAASFNEMQDMLEGVVHDLHQTVSYAKKGDLSQKIDVSQKEGFYKELFNAVNQMIEVFSDFIIDFNGVLDSVSKGDLTNKINHHYHGSFEKLKTHLNETIDSLEKLLKDIKLSTATISHAVKEIVLGNNDLAKRTDQQAAALEETSSSMEKITITVKQNTEDAKGVNELAQSVSSVALKAGTVVNQVVEMMNSINDSVHEVSEISNVIDNIAFQTNILALNAAVEAARAGEQGRGFSVVATEIRNLALRSSDSAKDIKTLINTTVERIVKGSKLVDEAGQTMIEVESSVSNVTEIMTNMAKAYIEQSNGIEQIYIAINQIDSVTQQNSALVEEAARASESLEQQTKNMDQLVDVFKISELSPEMLTMQNHVKPSYLKIERRKIKTAPPKLDEWTEF